ncbi:hypothetical protein CGLAUT_03285 [Corynebacterium glaucum]|nr:hypothetical protein CGLAUT_03285 [Corynebacterium glaucum]
MNKGGALMLELDLVLDLGRADLATSVSNPCVLDAREKSKTAAGPLGSAYQTGRPPSARIST